MRQHDPVNYHDHLGLDNLLSTQQPVSPNYGPEAHDETLFSIVHQAYELWFKQILHELGAVVAIFDDGLVREREMGALLGHLDRIVEVQRILVQQLDVLETMTPLDFRDLLIPASGFESLQFRLIENTLGVIPSQRVKINEAYYTERFSDEHRALLEASEAQTSLHDRVAAWLERTPFLESDNFAFWDAYRGAVERMLDREQTALRNNTTLPEHVRDSQIAGLDRNSAAYAPLFDDAGWTALQESGSRRLCVEHSPPPSSSTCIGTNRSSSSRSGCSPPWPTSTRGSSPGANATASW